MNWREWRPIDIEVTRLDDGRRAYDLIVRWDRLIIIALWSVLLWWLL